MALALRRLRAAALPCTGLLEVVRQERRRVLDHFLQPLFKRRPGLHLPRALRHPIHRATRALFPNQSTTSLTNASKRFQFPMPGGGGS